MFRSIPVCNKHLSKRWDEHTMQIHYNKLRRIKSAIDKSCPVTFGQLKHKPKKDQLTEERFTEIERENRLLLEKMSHIMNTRGNRSFSQTHKKSLNLAVRKRKLVQITEENQALLKRLQDKLPHYNVNKWEEERRESEKRLHYMCEYPYTLGGRRLYKKNNLDRKIVSIVPRSPASGKGRLSPLGSKIDKNICFKKRMNIGGRNFLIEVSKGKRKLKILVYEVDTTDSFSLMLTKAEFNDLCGGEDYEKLVNMLEIEDGELVLVDPRSASFNKENNEKEDSLIIESKSESVTPSHIIGNVKGSFTPQAGVEIHSRKLDIELYSKEAQEDLENQEEVRFNEKS
ncbi:unnamed protein product [Blepharisma stoltei]|uniref:Uncharacterized protein n=1 Tax=Blepharisma stoltei TaxID=1481888 RepID=A0AAU9JUR1_9CILI|nr:unnamed protein product [Blepharisma stoltei]